MKRPRRERAKNWKRHIFARRLCRDLRREADREHDERQAGQDARNRASSRALALLHDPRLRRLAGGRLG